MQKQKPQKLLNEWYKTLKMVDVWGQSSREINTMVSNENNKTAILRYIAPHSTISMQQIALELKLSNLSILKILWKRKFHPVQEPAY